MEAAVKDQSLAAELGLAFTELYHHSGFLGGLVLACGLSSFCSTIIKVLSRSMLEAAPLFTYSGTKTKNQLIFTISASETNKWVNRQVD